MCFSEKTLTGDITLERIDNIRADFVTTCSRSWTDSYVHILRLCIVFVSHALKRLRCDFGERAAPTCMNGSEGAGIWVANQNGHAVGRLNAGQNARGVADDRIAVNGFAACTFGRLSFRYSIYESHLGAVYLPAAGQRPFALKELEKTAPVLQNVFRCVFVKAGKIESVFWKRADAAESRGKTINEAGRFEWCTNERLNISELAPIKAGLL